MYENSTCAEGGRKNTSLLCGGGGGGRSRIDPFCLGDALFHLQVFTPKWAQKLFLGIRVYQKTVPFGKLHLAERETSPNGSDLLGAETVVWICKQCHIDCPPASIPGTLGPGLQTVSGSFPFVIIRRGGGDNKHPLNSRPWISLWSCWDQSFLVDRFAMIREKLVIGKIWGQRKMLLLCNW